MSDFSNFSSLFFNILSINSRIFNLHRQVELQKKIAAEVEAEGQRILALQAQLASQQQPQYQGHQGQHSQQSNNYNYNAQASNQYQQQAHAGYNSNAQQVGGAKPQQNYLPPGQHNYGRKWALN